MTSILTNSAAMAALQTLRSIDNGLETTQARVSSGLRVENASDNAAYWSIATTMRSDNRALSTVADALGLGAAKVDTAYTALENVIEVMSEIKAKLVAADLTAIEGNEELKSYAMQAGKSVFMNNCAQCHGSGAAGVAGKGYPNLLDNDWLWGGTLDDIHTTVTHGIRNTDDADARYSEMPRFGIDQMLDATQINQVTNHVLAISGQPHDAGLAAEGATVFADNCVSCHLEDGTGDRAQGAPNLTDAVWLYGGDSASIRQSVNDARFGVMPNWSPRLSEDDIRAVSYYVHRLGGGE